MKKRTYDRNNVYREAERLPAGGYIIKILKAEELNYSWGDVLLFNFDIAEGEHKDFYADNYRNQQGEDKKWKGQFRLNIPKDDGSEKDQWTQKKFNTTMANIEDSNPGYRFEWDENTLKGKIVGALFNNKEWEMNGKTGFATACHSFVTAETIRSGKFKIPADTLLKNRPTTSAAPTTDSSGFMNIPDGLAEELPF